MFPKHHAAQPLGSAQPQGSALPVWICTQLIIFAAEEQISCVDIRVTRCWTSISQTLASPNGSVGCLRIVKFRWLLVRLYKSQDFPWPVELELNSSLKQSWVLQEEVFDLRVLSFLAQYQY